MELSEIFRKAENKTLAIGHRFNSDSFACTESALGKVKFSWSGNTNYEIEMLTDLHIPRIRGLLYGESGILIYDDKQRDNVTGKEVTTNYKVQFRADFEYQSDNNFHVVQFKRVPEKSETTKGWIFESYNEGMMYVTGEGFPKDRDKALEKFQYAADQGHAGAKNMLEKFDDPNFCALTADDIANQGYAADKAGDDAKAHELWRKAADMGSSKAYVAIGFAYYKGKGVPQDYAKAIELFRKAADMGNAEAQSNLGACYRNGNGVPKDDVKSAEWYEKAAAQGHAGAMNTLGYCYLLGNGKPKDEKKAVELFRAAMDKGNVNAIDSLGECYRDGKGVERDFERAEALFNEAISKGNEASKANLEKLNEMMKKKGLFRKAGSSSSSSYDEDSEGHPTLFGIIGAIVVAIIGYNMLGWLGLIGGAIGGFFLGRWLNGKLIGRIVLVIALVVVGGGFIISKLPSKSKTETAETANAAAAATVNANVNFRADPSTGAKIIRQLQQGDTVTLTGETTGSWTQIKHGSDIGWVSSDFINTGETAPPTAQTAPQNAGGRQAAPEAAAVEPAAYTIGAKGPAGGLIFYVKNSNEDGWRYLEAAPQDIQGLLRADADRPDVNGNMDRAVGSGKSNSAALLRQAESRGGGVGWAVQACDVLAVNGYDDWFLPSRDELNHLYVNLHSKGLGNFRNEMYWSSTFDSGVWEWSCIDFSNGQYNAHPGASQYRVRACRQFSD